MKKIIFNQDPLFEFENPNHHRIKDELITFIYNDWELEKDRVHKRNDNTYVAVDNVSGKIIHPFVKNNVKESNFDFFERTHEVPLISNLFDFIHECMYNVQLYMNRKFCESHYYETKYAAWYHITNNNGYHDYHAHGRTLSAFYVIQGDPNYEKTNNGTFLFRDFNEPPTTDDPFCNYQSTAYSRMYIPTQRDGSLVIFPGWINHSAKPYIGEKDRIVLSINTFIGNIRDK